MQQKYCGKERANVNHRLKPVKEKLKSQRQGAYSFTFTQVKKNGSNILVLLFSIVLAGILLIQAWWVKSMLEMRNRQFDSAVVQALHATAGKLELKENVTIIKQSMGPPTPKKQPKKRKAKTTHQEIKIISGANVIHTQGKTVSSSYSYSMSNDSVRLKIEASAGDSDKDPNNTFVFNPGENAIIRMENTEESTPIEKKMSDIKVLIHKMAVSGKDSAQLLPKGMEINRSMAEALDDNGLDLPFDIGIRLNGKNYYMSPGADSTVVYASGYKTHLFPDDILNRKAELYVSFAGKRSYLFSEIAWILVLIIVFTAIIVYLFAYTLINYNRQKKLNQLKSDFINNMTHELKTPLATIQLASDMILKKSGDPDSSVMQMASTIKMQSKKIDEDVRNMLQIALLENPGAAILSYSACSVSELLNACREKMQLIAAQKNVLLEVQCERGLQVEADADLVQKAITNLVDNAIKYSQEGGRVWIQAQQNNTELLIKVTDNGTGIQASDLPHVFEKFYKAGKGNIHYNKGYGLGLSFVKKIALLHKGDAEAHSIPGKETILSIRIPIRK
jgi:two-component system phosphate regulon sensor histidine kinase PhoR